MMAGALDVKGFDSFLTGSVILEEDRKRDEKASR